MHPLLIKLGPFPIHTYGAMVALGFLGGSLLIRKLSVRAHLDPQKMIDLCFFGMLVGLLGARLLFVITRFSYFIRDPWAILRVWEGGLVFWGAPIAVVLWGVGYLKKNHIPFWKAGDVVVCGLVVGHSLGRLGCLGAGCCYGKPTGSSFGIRLNSQMVDDSLRGVLLHPTQLYEAGALAVLLVALLHLFKRKSFDGQVFLAYFMAYPIIRSGVEVFRGDLIRGFVIDQVISTSQFISILVFTVAMMAWFWRSRQPRNLEAT